MKFQECLLSGISSRLWVEGGDAESLDEAGIVLPKEKFEALLIPSGALGKNPHIRLTSLRGPSSVLSTYCKRLIPQKGLQFHIDDENISFEQASSLLGGDIAERVRETSLALYSFAAEHALERGIIIADTKFEFGLVHDRSAAEGELILIDEVLTPDSSRFWPAESYEPGRPQASFDKQFVRDYLEAIRWNKEAPAPELPDDVVEKTREKYQEALRRLTT